MIVRFVMMIVKVKGKDKKTISDEEKEEIRRQAIEEYRRSLEGTSEKAEEAQENAPADDDASGDGQA